MVVSLLIGCSGHDGEDGDIYIKFDWLTGDENYPNPVSDENPDTPIRISRTEEYPTVAGTYAFTYTINRTTYSDSYVLETSDGEDGKMFWGDGANGEDRHYTLWLYKEGPELVED